LRPAEAADVPTLAALARQTYAAAFGHTFEVASDLAAYLDEDLSETAVALWLEEDHVTVAELNGRIVAFSHFGPTPGGSYGGFPADGAPALHRLYVTPERFGEGIGSAMLCAALVDLEGAHNDIYLDVWEGNHGGLRLYARHGFAPLGRVNLATASGAPAGYDIVMVRRAAPL
jgi:GNAT superfamily N-acetyltransferase